MIYVITPFLSDVEAVCERESIPCFVREGKLLNNNIAWIFNEHQFIARKISNTDRVFYGDLSERLGAETLEKIYMEIRKRRKV